MQHALICRIKFISTMNNIEPWAYTEAQITHFKRIFISHLIKNFHSAFVTSCIFWVAGHSVGSIEVHYWGM